jgi:hypothetical protein
MDAAVMMPDKTARLFPGVAAALLILGCASTSPAKVAGDERCLAAEALLSAVPMNEGDAWFNLSPPSDQFSWKLRQDTELSGDWQGQSPRAATISEFRRATAGSAFTCENMRTMAEKRGTLLTQDQGSTRLRQLGLNGKYQFFHTFSLPAVAGDDAISIAVTSSNQLAGDVKLIFLKRTRQGWHVAGSYLIGVG